MGLGPGSGARNARLWLPRLVLLAVFAALALFARGHGGHSGFRGASYLAILGLLLLRFVARTRRRSSGGLRRFGPPSRGSGRSDGARFGPGGPFWGATGPGSPGAFPAARPEVTELRPKEPDPDRSRLAGDWPPPGPGATPVDSPVTGPGHPER